MKNAYLDETLRNFVLYFSSFVCCDWRRDPQLSIRIFQATDKPRLQHYLRFNNKYSDKLSDKLQSSEKESRVENKLITLNYFNKFRSTLKQRTKFLLRDVHIKCYKTEKFLVMEETNVGITFSAESFPRSHHELDLNVNKTKENSGL
jgi:hypothetical protein